MSKEKEVIEEVQVKNENLTQEQALDLLIQAVKLAQRRGAFELQETELLLKAVNTFNKKD